MNQNTEQNVNKQFDSQLNACDCIKQDKAKLNLSKVPIITKPVNQPEGIPTNKNIFTYKNHQGLTEVIQIKEEAYMTYWVGQSPIIVYPQTKSNNPIRLYKLKVKIAIE